MLSGFRGSVRRGIVVVNLAMALALAIGSGGVVGARQQQTSGAQRPAAACPDDGTCFADVPPDNIFYEFVNRLYRQNVVTGYSCGGLSEPCDAENRPYYRPGAGVTRQQMAKFVDNARRLPQISIDVASGPPPIYGRNGTGTGIAAASTSGHALSAISTTGIGVYAQTSGLGAAAVSGFATAASGKGVQGTSNAPTGGVGVRGDANCSSCKGVHGYSTDGTGVQGTSATEWGVYGVSNSTDQGIGTRGLTTCETCHAVEGSGGYGIGVFGVSYSEGSYSYAGWFDGEVEVTGNLSKGGGAFKIDHPLDPENKYLYHSFVESPDMMNVYNGNVTTDTNGEAVVTLPDYFEALNRDYRYQLTVIGQFSQAIVWKKIEQGRFTIKTDKPNVEVSWQVTGIRQDPYANANRIQVEEVKPDRDKGKYLHPAEWGQPLSEGVVVHPEREP
ncbi:MAG TPA: S-layer homology domain-containing protein [Chloroflexia bacterium]